MRPPTLPTLLRHARTPERFRPHIGKPMDQWPKTLTEPHWLWDGSSTANHGKSAANYILRYIKGENPHTDPPTQYYRTYQLFVDPTRECPPNCVNPFHRIPYRNHAGKRRPTNLPPPPPSLNPQTKDMEDFADCLSLAKDTFPTFNDFVGCLTPEGVSMEIILKFKPYFSENLECFDLPPDFKLT